MMPTMDSILNQINEYAAAATEETRSKLMSSLNQLLLSMESPNDTVHRYGHMVRLQLVPNSFYRLTMITEPAGSCHSNWL